MIMDYNIKTEKLFSRIKFAYDFSKYGNNSVDVHLPLTSYSDQMVTGSLSKLIMKFNKQTMYIYDAILSQKRVLFSGSLKFSTDHIGEYVAACA